MSTVYAKSTNISGHCTVFANQTMKKLIQSGLSIWFNKIL